MNTVNTTTPVNATETNTPATVMIDGKAFIIGENNFYISLDSGKVDFINIGDGVWYNTETKQKLIGFTATVDGHYNAFLITDRFNWEELFNLPIKARGIFNECCISWCGTLINNVGEKMSADVTFIYMDGMSILEHEYKKGRLKVINSVEELIELFPSFGKFYRNKGSRFINPLLRVEDISSCF